jgi:hypothetical protein
LHRTTPEGGRDDTYCDRIDGGDDHGPGARNEQAAQNTGGSALPHQGDRTPGTHREPSAPPPADATRPDVPRGPGDRGAGGDPRDGASTPLPGTGAPGERTDPSGSVITETPDPLLKGMDATRVDDPLYRAAYRDCMRARLGAR